MNRPMSSIEGWTANPIRRNPKQNGTEIIISVPRRPNTVRKKPDTRLPAIDPSGGMLPVTVQRMFTSQIPWFDPCISLGSR